MRGRALAGVVALTTLALGVTGCTSSADPDGQPSPSPSLSSAATTASSGPVSLRLEVYGDETMRAAYQQLARAYSSKNPRVSIEVESSRTSDAATARLEGEFTTGDAPDLFVTDSSRAPSLVASERVRPVDDLLEQRGVLFGDDYQRLGLEAFSAEQALQCMPIGVSPLVVFYNEQLLPFGKLAGPGEEPVTPETGWTWDQFTHAARLMSHGKVKGVYVEPRLATVMALVRSAGSDVVDDPRQATTLTLADDGTRAALEEILAVVRDPDLTPNQRQLAKVDWLSRFADGRIGMVVATRKVVPRLRRVEGLDFDVFPLPRLARPRSMADVTGLCVSAETDKVEAAADFLAFAAGGEGAAMLAETGAVVPAHLPTLNSTSFTQPGEQPENVTVFDDAVSRSGVDPFVLGWAQLEEEMRGELGELWADPVLDLDEQLPRLDKRSAEILQPMPPTDG